MAKKIKKINKTSRPVEMQPFKLTIPWIAKRLKARLDAGDIAGIYKNRRNIDDICQLVVKNPKTGKDCFCALGAVLPFRAIEEVKSKLLRTEGVNVLTRLKSVEKIELISHPTYKLLSDLVWLHDKMSEKGIYTLESSILRDCFRGNSAVKATQKNFTKAVNYLYQRYRGSVAA